jgi:hypothetical protein
MMHLLTCCSLLLLTASTVFADFTGQVVRVLDGDTIEVLHNQDPERIRLSGIDCPEKSQAYGQRAKQTVLPAFRTVCLWRGGGALVGYFVRYHVIRSRTSTARTTPPTTDVSNCVPVSPVHSNSASNMRSILGVGQANYKAGRGAVAGQRESVLTCILGTFSAPHSSHGPFQ